jgi:NitT/TauT family transport system permease protein
MKAGSVPHPLRPPAVRVPVAWPRVFASPTAAGAGAAVVALGLWQVAVLVTQVPAYYIPSPLDIAAALWRGRHLYPLHFAYTMYATLAGFAIALLTGVALGTLVSEVAFLERTVLPLLVAGQSMPRIALAPIVIVWFGFGIASKIVLATFSAFFPIFLSVVHGLGTANQEQVALLRSFRASRWQIFRYVKLPNAVPFLMAGANVSVIFSMLATIVAEFLGANRGMGYLIVQESNQLDTAGVFATISLLSCAGLVLHYGIQGLRRRLLGWATLSELGGSRT